MSRISLKYFMRRFLRVSPAAILESVFEPLGFAHSDNKPDNLLKWYTYYYRICTYHCTSFNNLTYSCDERTTSRAIRKRLRVSFLSEFFRRRSANYCLPIRRDIYLSPNRTFLCSRSSRSRNARCNFGSDRRSFLHELRE